MMLNYIWGALMLVSLVVAAFTGRLEAVTTGAMNGASDAVTLSISLLGIMCLWTGLMKIASSSGIINIFARVLRPLTKILFPRLPQNSPAMDCIVMNMVANLFGMSNAATPLGLKAMKELSRLERGNIASDNMCMFVVINSASLQLIPSTVIAIRQSIGSSNPFEIIMPVWIASLIALIVGVSAAKLFALGGRV